MRLGYSASRRPLGVDGDGFGEELAGRAWDAPGVAMAEVGLSGGRIDVTPDAGPEIRVPASALRRMTFTVCGRGLALEAVYDAGDGEEGSLVLSEGVSAPDALADAQRLYDAMYDLADAHDAGVSPGGERVAVFESQAEYDAFEAAVEAARSGVPSDAASSDAAETMVAEVPATPAGGVGDVDIDRMLASLLGGVDAGGDPGREAPARRGLAGDLAEAARAGTDADGGLRGRLTEQYVANERLRGQVEELRARAGELEAQASAGRAELDAARREAGELRELVASASADRDAAVRRMDEEAERHAVAEADLRSKMAAAAKMLDAVRGGLKSEVGNRERLEGVIDSYRERVTGLGEEVGRLQRELAAARDEAAGLDARIMAERAKADDEARAAAEAADARVAEAIGRADAADEEARRVREEAMAGLRRLTDEGVRRLDEQRRRHEEEKARLASQMEELTRLLDDVTEDRDAVRGQLAVLARDANAGTSRIEEAERARSEAESRCETARKAVEALREAVADAERRVEEERRASDLARSNASRMAGYAAEKYAEAIAIRTACESAVMAVRRAVDGDGDEAEVRERLAAALRAIDASRGRDAGDMPEPDGAVEPPASIEDTASELLGRIAAEDCGDELCGTILEDATSELDRDEVLLGLAGDDYSVSADADGMIDETTEPDEA